MSAESKSRKSRYISAAVGIPFGLGICLFLPTFFNLVAVILITVGMVEFYAMARNRGFSPHSIVGTLCSI